ncbi:unnamed protein product, partial [Didymodactylos carnosus]
TIIQKSSIRSVRFPREITLISTSSSSLTSPLSSSQTSSSSSSVTIILEVINKNKIKKFVSPKPKVKYRKRTTRMPLAVRYHSDSESILSLGKCSKKMNKYVRKYHSIKKFSLQKRERTLYDESLLDENIYISNYNDDKHSKTDFCLQKFLLNYDTFVHVVSSSSSSVNEDGKQNKEKNVEKIERNISEFLNIENSTAQPLKTTSLLEFSTITDENLLKQKINDYNGNRYRIKSQPIIFQSSLFGSYCPDHRLIPNEKSDDIGSLSLHEPNLINNSSTNIIGIYDEKQLSTTSFSSTVKSPVIITPSELSPLNANPHCWTIAFDQEYDEKEEVFDENSKSYSIVCSSSNEGKVDFITPSNDRNIDNADLLLPFQTIDTELRLFVDNTTSFVNDNDLLSHKKTFDRTNTDRTVDDELNLVGSRRQNSDLDLTSILTIAEDLNIILNESDETVAAVKQENSEKDSKQQSSIEEIIRSLSDEQLLSPTQSTIEFCSDVQKHQPLDDGYSHQVWDNIFVNPVVEVQMDPCRCEKVSRKIQTDFVSFYSTTRIHNERQVRFTQSQSTWNTNLDMNVLRSANSDLLCYIFLPEKERLAKKYSYCNLATSRSSYITDKKTNDSSSTTSSMTNINNHQETTHSNNSKIFEKVFFYS